MSWEYTTTVIHHGLLGKNRDEVDRAAVEARLNELGAEGWELVGLAGDRGQSRLIFKCPGLSDA